MYSVKCNLLGSALWAARFLPMSFQAASGLLRIVSDEPLVREAKIEASGEAKPSRALDVKA